jgi:hypothetical protein
MSDFSRSFRPARVWETMQTHFEAAIACGQSVTADRLMRDLSINSQKKI